MRYRHFLRVATLITRDEGTAHDAVHEGFAATFRSLTSYRAEGPQRPGSGEPLSTPPRSSSDILGRSAGRSRTHLSQNGDETEARLIRTWIAALPERQRLIVDLGYYADLDYRQIATVLDIAVGTVAATLSAALQTLRTTIEEVPR